MCIEFWLILYTLNDMIEKLCPGLALCSVYNHLFLLCSSKIIFPIRAALFCFSTNMEARSLVSTSWVLCTADSVFYCMLNYDSHILVGTKLSLSLDTRDHVLVCMWGSVWDVKSLLPHFQYLWLPRGFLSCLFSLLIPRVKGASRGEWVAAHRPWGPCLGSVSWSSSQPLHQQRLMCWRCFHVRGPHSAAPRDPPWLQMLESVKGPLGFFTHLLSQPCWPGLLGLSSPSTASPGVTAALRTHCSIQSVLPLLLNPRPAPSSVLSLHLPSLIPPNFRSLSANPAANRCLWRTLVTSFWLNEIVEVFASILSKGLGNWRFPRACEH